MCTVAKFNWLRWLCGIASVALISLVNAEPLTFSEKIELPCVEYPRMAKGAVGSGLPGAIYYVTMMGLKKEGSSQVIETTKVSDHSAKTNDDEGLDVSVNVRCSSFGRWNTISYTGASKACLEGEEIALELVRPNCPDDLGRYSAVLELTVTWNREDCRRLLEEELSEQEDFKERLAIETEKLARIDVELGAAEERVERNVRKILLRTIDNYDNSYRP